MAILSTPLQYITATPPVTRAFTALTLVFSVLYMTLAWQGHSAPYLVLVPGHSIFYPWTFVTSALVETNPIEVRTFFPPRCTVLLKRSKTAAGNTHCHSAFAAVPRASLGRNRDAQVYHRPTARVQHHRVRVQLDRVHGHIQRRPFSVSSICRLLAIFSDFAYQVWNELPRADGDPDCRSCCLYTADPRASSSSYGRHKGSREGPRIRRF
jgi:hypothetical protein